MLRVCCLNKHTAISWPILPLRMTTSRALTLKLDGGRSPYLPHLELGYQFAGFHTAPVPWEGEPPCSTPANLRTFHFISWEPEFACAPPCLFKGWLRAILVSQHLRPYQLSLTFPSLSLNNLLISAATNPKHCHVVKGPDL